MFTRIKRIGLITGVMVFVWSFVSGILQGITGGVDPNAAANPEEALGSLLALLAICLLNAILVVWYVERTTRRGLSLGLILFTLVFGVMFFMTQIETIFFNETIEMPMAIVYSTIATGVFVGAVAAWFGVRYAKKLPEPESGQSAPSISVGLVGSLTAIAAIYVVFYFLFGYFIAWQFPALRDYYTGSTDILPFFAHMTQQIQTDAILIFFQVIRGYLWAAIAYVLAINLGRIGKVESLILVGLALSIGLATPLWVPNPFMPGPVRFGHFFELLIENFLLGVIAAWLFLYRPQANRATETESSVTPAS